MTNRKADKYRDQPTDTQSWLYRTLVLCTGPNRERVVFKLINHAHYHRSNHWEVFYKVAILHVKEVVLVKLQATGQQPKVNFLIGSFQGF